MPEGWHKCHGEGDDGPKDKSPGPAVMNVKKVCVAI